MPRSDTEVEAFCRAVMVKAIQYGDLQAPKRPVGTMRKSLNTLHNGGVPATGQRPHVFRVDEERWNALVDSFRRRSTELSESSDGARYLSVRVNIVSSSTSSPVAMLNMRTPISDRRDAIRCHQALATRMNPAMDLAMTTSMVALTSTLVLVSGAPWRCLGLSPPRGVSPLVHV